MDALLSEFGLDTSEFGVFLDSVGGFIAGSASLHAFAPFKNDEKPNDIDVWIPIAGFIAQESSDKYDKFVPNDQIATCKVAVFGYMTATGFTRNMINTNPQQKEKMATYFNERQSCKFIKAIMTFVKNGKSVQFMLTDDMSQNDILASFDLTICQIAWKPAIGFIPLNAAVLQDIEDRKYNLVQTKEMLAAGPAADRLLDRLEKYMERGFLPR